MIVTVYTDGSSKGTPGPGGYGAYISWGDAGYEEHIVGGHPSTTNNRMELLGAISAIVHVDKCVRELEDASSVELVLFVDSEYVRKGITEWIKSWKKNGWKTSSRKPVVNQDLWMVFDAAVQNHPFKDIRWNWVKGHSGVHGNEMADRLADQGARISPSRGEFQEIREILVVG